MQDALLCRYRLAKTFHVAYVVNQDDKVIKKSLKFNNDESGFDELLLLLNSIDEVSSFTILVWKPLEFSLKTSIFI